MRAGIISLVLIGLTAVEMVIPQEVQVGRAPRRILKRKTTVALDGTGSYTSIQAAIDAAEFNATITIKEGVYRERILLKSFVNLKGDGIGKTILTSIDESSVVEAYNTGGGTISDLSFRGKYGVTTSLLFAKFSQFSIDRCSFNGAVSGIVVLNKSQVNVRDCQLATFSGEAIVYKDRSHGYVVNCTINNAQTGILVEEGASPTVEKNSIFSNSVDGMLVRQGSTNKIIGNIIAFNGRHGILVEGNSSPLVRNNTIHGNGRQSAGGLQFGLLLQNTSAVSVVNNSITGNVAGLGLVASTEVSYSHNNVWNNDSNYVGTSRPDSDLSVDPMYRDASRLLFQIDNLSPLYRKGEDAVSIGADFDNTRLEKKRRLNYLKTTAARDLSQGNYYTAYQSALEILQIDNEDTEGRSLKRKAGSEIANAYVRNAGVDFDAGNYRIAENYIRAALSYDSDNQDAKELRAQIEDIYSSQRVKTALFVGAALLLVGAGGWWWKKRIVLGEVRRQVKWWLDDANEQLEIAKAIHGERHDPEGLVLAQKKLQEAHRLFEAGEYETCEHTCNESARYSARVKDETEKQQRLRQAALLELTEAEEKMNAVSQVMLDRFPDDIREFKFYLERAQEAVRTGQFHLAKEISEDLQTSLRRLDDRLEDERLRSVRQLIIDTEQLIIETLTTNDSPEIIEAVMDFRTDLDILKSGFEAGQVSMEEVLPQIRQINEFVTEAQKLGGGAPAGRGRKRSYYDILGVKENASLEQIKAVYRKLSMIYHPDMNAAHDLGIASDERFKEIKEAYDILVEQKTKNGEE